MSIDIHEVPYGSQTISFELNRSERKTLAIHVHSNMRVEVVAPMKAYLEDIYKKVRKRAKWIKTQQLFFDQFQPKEPPRQYVAGENHYYLGRQLRLKVKQAIANKINIEDDFIVVYSHYPSNLKLTQNLIENWFKTQACEKFNERLSLCLNEFSKPEEFLPKSIIIRHLNKRWGSMTSTKRLVLNTKLIHMPLYCIDYVIIHELCHIQHPNHSPKFWNLLASIMPDWEQRKNKLEGLE